MRTTLRRIVVFFLLFAASVQSANPQGLQDIRFPRIAIFLAGHQQRWSLLITAGIAWATQDRHELADAAFRTALRVAERTSGLEDVRVATSLRYLVVLLDQERKYAAAELLTLRALRICEHSLGKDDPAVADELIELARLNVKEQKLIQAEPLYLRALQIRKQVLIDDRDRAPIADVLSDLAAVYVRQQRYSEAEQLYEQALNIKIKALGDDDLDIANTWLAQASLHLIQGRYLEAEELYRQALRLQEKQGLDQDDPLLIPTLNALANLYELQGDTKNSVSLRQRAMRIRDQSLQHLPEDALHKYWVRLVDDFFSNVEYSRQRSLADRALRFAQAYFGPDNWRVSFFLVFRATQQFRFEGASAKTELFYRRALRTQEATLGTEDPSIARTITEFAGFYRQDYKDADAELLLRRGQRIQRKMLRFETAEDPFTGIHITEQLAFLYLNRGRYDEAVKELADALVATKNSKGPEKPKNYATEHLLRTLAAVYIALNDPKKAEQLLLEAIQIDGRPWGLGWPSWVPRSVLSGDLMSLGELYSRQGRWADAELQYRRALHLTPKAPIDPRLDAMDHLATVYWNQNQYGKADLMYRKELDLARDRHLKWNESVILAHLGWFYVLRDKYAEGAEFLSESLRKQSLEDLHSLASADTLYKMALAMFYLHRPMEGEAMFRQIFDNLKYQLQYYFTYMKEQDRVRFMSHMDYYLSLYYNLVEKFGEEDQQTTADIYDLVLWRKGLVLRSMEMVQRKISLKGTEKEKELLKDFLSAQSQLSSLVNDRTEAPSSSVKEQIHSLRDHTAAVWGTLARISPALRAYDDQAPSWEKVRDSLRNLDADAAVEFVSFPFYDRTLPTGQRHYAALMITQSGSPQLLWLKDGEEAARLGSEARIGYKKYVEWGAPPSDAKAFYTAFWEPVETALVHAQQSGTSNDKGLAANVVQRSNHPRPKIYVAPDGFLNEVSLGVLPLDNRQLLMEKYDLRIVNSTGDLINAINRADNPDSTRPRTAVLFGDPKFDMNDADYRAALEGMRQASETLASRRTRVDEFATDSLTPLDLKRGTFCLAQESVAQLCPLPKTAEEVRSIYRLLQEHHWQVQEPYTGANALEENVKRVQHPTVLHLATHGYFDEDAPLTDEMRFGQPPQPWQDPLLRSGLYFAGADHALRHETTAAGLDDGVLTALEARDLDLHGTELVVLSACNTGLGDVTNGDGVFGLRRSLQQAGANSVLMSMWSVPDQPTRELMEKFYSKWLSGMDKHEALREAQLEMKQQTSNPYSWGAFVLIGP